MTDDRMLARIGALLRQAEGTDNPHEAEAFMAAAQRLATATSIDLAVARAHSTQRGSAQTPTQRTITIGEPGSRGLRTYVQLFAVIAAANDVRCDVASNSSFVYAYGFSEDIDTTHALYASLVVQMVRSCDAYLATGAHRPTPTITARLNFQLAFGARIGSGFPRPVTRPNVRPPNRGPPRREPPWHCATRRWSCATTTGSSRRPGVRGGRAELPPGTPRPLAGPGTGPAGRPASGRARNCRGPVPG